MSEMQQQSEVPATRQEQLAQAEQALYDAFREMQQRRENLAAAWREIGGTAQLRAMSWATKDDGGQGPGPKPQGALPEPEAATLVLQLAAAETGYLSAWEKWQVAQRQVVRARMAAAPQ